MRASDLRISALPERRTLIWDAEAFGDLRRELVETLGLDRTRPILRRFGFAAGYRDAVMTGERFSWDDDVQWWLSCPELLRHEGKVSLEPRRLIIDRSAGAFELELEWTGSYEAEQHRKIFGGHGEPVCWVLAGFASGFSTAVIGEEVYVVETECAAMGGDRCRATGKTRRGWSEQGADHAAEYEPRPLAAELEAREAELRRQRRDLRRRERDLARAGAAPLTARSRQMERVLALAHAAARSDAAVLISGERGTGKERIARLIHDDSERAGDPFIAVHGAALPETLLGSELVEATRGGTLFLDEIGAASPASQAELSRLLAQRDTARVLAATHRVPEEMVETGELRADLFEHLRGVAIELPPLRERRDDIMPLARELLGAACAAFDLDTKTIAPEAIEALLAHDWPGNVRELENAIERAVVVSGDRPRIDRGDLPPEVRERGAAGLIGIDEVVPLAELEKRYVLEVLRRFDGNRTHTARALGVGANTLWRKLKSWGVPPKKQP